MDSHWLPTWHLHAQATGYQVQTTQALGNTSVWKIYQATSVGTQKVTAGNVWGMLQNFLENISVNL